MGAGHAHALYVHEHSSVHRLAAEVKVAGAFAFVLAVAITPGEQVWAFAVHAAILATIARLARLSARFVLARTLVVVPFIAFALFLPFIASGEGIEIAGVAVSKDGLWGAWNIVAKASLGVTVSILLAGTTSIADILRGLERLHVPQAFTMIAMFMMRYLELIAAQLRQTRTAMTARGYDPRWLWQVRPLAAASGSLFIRSYERGERVHSAMLARGYTGVMPSLGEPRATRLAWAVAAVPPGLAAMVAAAALVSS